MKKQIPKNAGKGFKALVRFYDIIIKMIDVFSDEFKNSCINKESNLQKLEEELEFGIEFIEPIYRMEKSLEKNVFEGLYKYVGENFNKAVKDFEQAHKELCHYVTSLKLLGQE